MAIYKVTFSNNIQEHFYFNDLDAAKNLILQEAENKNLDWICRYNFIVYPEDIGWIEIEEIGNNHEI